MAETLPDEIWSRILEIGITNSILSFKDICCTLITNKRFYQVSNESFIWSKLISQDFPTNYINHNPKCQYKLLYEKNRDRKVAAHRRAVLKIESEIDMCSGNVGKLRRKLVEENERLKVAVEELAHLENVRRTSVALNVWQPEIVRGWQKQVVKQCVVPIESRITAVEMEIKLCRQQIAVFGKAYSDEKQRLHLAKEKLGSVKYHPLRNYQFMNTQLCKHDCQQKKPEQFRKRVCHSQFVNPKHRQ